jgi:hypothetical protein
MTVGYIFIPETKHATLQSSLDLHVYLEPTESITETWSALTLRFQAATLLSDVVLALLPTQSVHTLCPIRKLLIN